MISWIKSYEGLYSIDSCGNVYSHPRRRRTRTIVLSTSLDRYNRVRVHLYKNSLRKNKQVHRLVAEAFLKDYSEDLTVNHKDGDPHNNNVSNLEMVTGYANMQHAISLGLVDQKGEKHSQAILATSQVLEIKELLEKAEISQRAIAKFYGVHFNTISQISLGTRWKHI